MVKTEDVKFDFLTDEENKKIQAKCEALKDTHEIDDVFVFVDNRIRRGKNKRMIAYFKTPQTTKEISVYLYNANSDPVEANRKLAKTCFLDGDRDLVDVEKYYVTTGLMNEVIKLIPQGIEGEIKAF